MFATGLLIPKVDFVLPNVISQVTPMLFRDALFHSEEFLGLNITHTTKCYHMKVTWWFTLTISTSVWLQNTGSPVSSSLEQGCFDWTM